MRVTVGIKAYKHEAFIAQAIESALAQVTTFAFEILIAEDFSPDRTREIVEGFATAHPGRIRLFLPPQNIGRHRIVEELCRQAAGEFIALMDGDDYWSDVSKLQRQVEFMDANASCSCCCHDAVVEYDDGTLPHRYIQKPRRAVYTLCDFLSNQLPIPTSSVLFRRGLFGEYPEWFFKTQMADFPMHVLNAQHGDIGFIDRPMMVYRRHAGGIWSEGAKTWTAATAIKRYQALMELFEALGAHLGGLHREVIDQNISDLCYDMVWSQLCMGNLVAVRRFLRKAARLRGTVPNVSNVFRLKVYALAYVPGLYWAYRALRPDTVSPHFQQGT